MQGANNTAIQQEIQSNMSAVSRQEPGCINEELALQNNKQAWVNSRANRKNNNLNKPDQPNSPRDFANSSGCENNAQKNKSTVDETRSTQTWLENVDLRVKSAYSVNNRSCSENLDTMKENFRNSQESLKRRNSENIMAIEMNMRASRNPMQSTGHELVRPRGNSMSSGSLYSLGGGQDDLDPNLRISQAKDPYTAAIDLSNSCRQFYFSHMKTAEAIKQSVRTARHTRAREKMEGKQPSSLDTAMEKLRAEMADLMDQDLSLMSQLLKLNDKIEDIKTQVSQRLQKDDYNSCYLSSTDMSDSEMSDNEGSRMDLTKSVNSPHGYASMQRRHSAQPDIPLRRDPSQGDIIIYRKRTHRKKLRKQRSCSGTDEDTAKEDNDEEEEEEEEEDDVVEESEITSEDETDKEHTEKEEDSNSDSGSTISNKSTVSEISVGEAKTEKANSDSGFQSPTANKESQVPAKPVKGGVSRNTSFLNFHKNVGPVRSANGHNPILTVQGHNINVEKFYIPQSLVYLKHTNGENVFCQFNH